MRPPTRVAAAVLTVAAALAVAGPAGAATARSDDAPPTDDTPAATAGSPGTATPASWSFSGFGADGTPLTTEAFVGGGRTPIVGDFSGSNAADILWYTPGAGGDALWTGNGDLTFASGPTSVSGTYTPLVGTFRGGMDGKDDILWYSTTGASQLWDFNADGTITTTALPSVTGPGTLLVGDFAGDGIDDVLRYRAGSASDSWWDFQVVNIVSRAFSVNGTYRPLVGQFAGDAVEDVFWYAPGAAADSLWDFEGGGARSEWSLSVSGTYTPVVGAFSDDGEDDILWYAPGSGADAIWRFANGTVIRQPLTVNGTYSPVPCACIQGAASPYDDVFWFRAGSAADVAWEVTDGDPFAYTTRAATATGTAVGAVGAFHTGTSRETLLVRT